MPADNTKDPEASLEKIAAEIRQVGTTTLSLNITAFVILSIAQLVMLCFYGGEKAKEVVL